MFNIIIFSKDRACQLDLLLRSFRDYFRGDMDDNIRVLYTYSDDKYKEGYDILMGHKYGVPMILEESSNFKRDTEALIMPELPYTLFLVDDDVLKSEFQSDCKEMQIFACDPDILCLSLRLYKGINYCYTIPCDSPAPALSVDNTWEWKGQLGDWGYPMSLDGHIFRTSEILPLIKSLGYSSPNTLEGTLANNPLPQSKMICLDQSVVLNNPCNKVQIDNGNHCGHIPASFLNTMYLRNQYISLNNLRGIQNRAPHQEVEILFEEL